MKAIDLTAQSRDLHLRFDSSPVYDFLAALFLIRHWVKDAGFDVDPSWVATARRTLGRAWMAEARLLFPRQSPVLGILSALEGSPGASINGFLGLLSRTTPQQVMERMLGSGQAMRPVLPQLRQAIDGDRGAADAALVAYPPEYDLRALRRILNLRPVELKTRLLRLLRGFHTRVYAREEARVVPLLARDVAERQRLYRVLSPTETIERATGGFVLTPGAGVTAVLLAPSYFFRPYNLVTEYYGVRVHIYPIATADGAESHDRPPQELVRFYKALSDETRLRILRLLAQREMYVQEVANALGVTHVTALHHLAQLRAAHLVQAVERDTVRVYRVHPQGAAGAEARWREYLKR